MKSKILLGALIILSACGDDVPVSVEEQRQSEIAEIAAYLEEHPPADEDIVVRDGSGITLVISEMGTGIMPPDQKNELTVAYKGSLLSNGYVFDDQYSTVEDPLRFRQSNLSVINGWKIALSMMTEGTVAKVYIPSVHAYGRSGKETIPGNATLVFEMNIIDVNETDAQLETFQNEKEVISGVLEGTPDLDVKSTGITMIHTQVGTGASPGPYDQVEIKYSGFLLSDSTAFLEAVLAVPSVNFSNRPVNYVRGFSLALQSMKEGGKARVFVPATLGYGSVAGPYNIPANANLFYDIELTKVIPLAE